ncbi:15194_t:CDS:2, partial [Cetraspora pellucida]
GADAIEAEALATSCVEKFLLDFLNVLGASSLNVQTIIPSDSAEVWGGIII